MLSKLKVFKFGGASVKDADGVKNVAKVLNVTGVDNKVVVLGAKTGATPTAVAGGLYYSGSDHWFLGFEGSGLP